MCQNCGKNEANFRYTQIINGVKKEIILCSECAKKLGLDNMEMPISFSNFIGDFFNDYVEDSLLPSFSTNSVKCKTCKMSYNDFINTGMFGCSDCYDIFSNPIDSLLKNLHGTAKHIGRGAKEIANNKIKTKKVKQPDEKEDMQKELDKAIKEERYEDAAKIRDKIKEMEK